MIIRKAGMEDLEALFACRIEFIKDLRNHEVEVSEDFQVNTYEYMKEHIADNSLVTWIAEDNGEMIASVMVSYYQILPVMSNASGRTGYILNVYTDPAYRRRGIATQLLHKIVEESKSRNVGKLYLTASEMGMPVYKKFGFEVLDRDMVYKVM